MRIRILHNIILAALGDNDAIYHGKITSFGNGQRYCSAVYAHLVFLITHGVAAYTSRNVIMLNIESFLGLSWGLFGYEEGHKAA